MDISQLDALVEGSQFFRYREFLWLPQWSICAFPTPVQLANIKKVAVVMDEIRKRFGKPIVITSGLRPTKYNEWRYPNGVGGAKASAHIEGKACDFQVVTIPPDEVQHELSAHLENLKIRMERNTPSWTHIDIRDPGAEGNRHFYASGSLG